MNKSYKYLAIAAFAASVLLSGCTQDTPEGLSSDLIRINAVGNNVATKGFLNAADLPVAGTTVKIYDDLTGFSGKINGTSYTSAQVVPYMGETETLEYGSGSWAFGSGIPWRWTRTGVHHFYGWLTKDKDGLTPAHIVDGFVPTLTSEKKLKVPTTGSITFTKSTDQFDFSYSGMVDVDVTAEGFNASNNVKLPLTHLFTGVSFSIQNRTTDGKYTIKDLQITGIRNQGSATIDYSISDNQGVKYTEPVVSGKFVNDISTDIVLESGYSYDILGASSSVVANNVFDPEFKLLWPLTKEQVQEILITGHYEIDGNVDEGGVQIVSPINLKLTVNGIFSPWEEGHKNKYSLIFSDKAITLVYSVLPWDYIKTDLDFAAHSLSATALRLEGGTHSGNNYIVSTTADPIVGSFQIWTPVGAIWRVTMEGDTEFFTLEDNQGTIDPSVENGAVSFRIIPNTEVKAANPGTTARITLKFSVETSNGDELSGDSEINRDNIQIVY